MKIVIDSRPLLKNRLTVENGRYITHCLVLLAREKPQVEFCFLTDESPTAEKEFAFFENNTVIKKSFAGPLGGKIWRDWQIPAVVKKQQADLLLMPGGISSTRVSIPQCVWMPSMPGHPESKKQWSTVQQKLQSTVRAAGIVLVDSEKSEQWLLRQIPQAGEKIRIVHPAADEDYQPLSWTEKENTKVKYAGGKEYFLCIQSHPGQDAFINLLKAFSQFKIRQQSNLQLLIITAMYSVEMAGKFETYKYRTDVHIHDRPEQAAMVKIMAAAYAFLQPGDDNIAVLNAFRANVPVIAGKDCSPEITGDAVLYADPTDHEQVAAQMMLLYKDEILRNELIEKGKIQEGQFSWQRSATELWEGVMEAVNQH
jgi:glycosyltransferase involved in cell wall biosynthesis